MESLLFKKLLKKLFKKLLKKLILATSALFLLAGTAKAAAPTKPLLLNEATGQRIHAQSMPGVRIQAIGFFVPVSKGPECQFAEDRENWLNEERAVFKGGVVPASGVMDLLVPELGTRSRCQYKLNSISLVIEYKKVLTTFKIVTSATVAASLKKPQDLYSEHPPALPETIDLSCEFSAKVAGLCWLTEGGSLPFEMGSDLQQVLNLKISPEQTDRN